MTSATAERRVRERRIKKRLDDEGIEAPVPQRKVHIQIEGGAVRPDAITIAGAVGG